MLLPERNDRARRIRSDLRGAQSPRLGRLSPPLPERAVLAPAERMGADRLRRRVDGRFGGRDAPDHQAGPTTLSEAALHRSAFRRYPPDPARTARRADAATGFRRATERHGASLLLRYGRMGLAPGAAGGPRRLWCRATPPGQRLADPAVLGKLYPDLRSHSRFRPAACRRGC